MLKLTRASPRRCAGSHTFNLPHCRAADALVSYRRGRLRGGLGSRAAWGSAPKPRWAFLGGGGSLFVVNASLCRVVFLSCCVIVLLCLVVFLFPVPSLWGSSGLLSVRLPVWVRVWFASPAGVLFLRRVLARLWGGGCFLCLRLVVVFGCLRAPLLLRLGDMTDYDVDDWNINVGDWVQVYPANEDHEMPQLYVNKEIFCYLSPEGVEKIRAIVN